VSGECLQLRCTSGGGHTDQRMSVDNFAPKGYVATVATIGVCMMGVMSIREFNKNASAAFAKVQAGETLDITKNGEVIAEIRPKRKNRMDDPEYRAKYEKMMAMMHKGIPGLKAPLTYEERTEG
jgi:antitoxin (DNA-binding transcriptional repressor) of toxin-antitoxin stability system